VRLRQRDLLPERRAGEGAIAVVAIEAVGAGGVGDVQIGPTVVVEVAPRLADGHLEADDAVIRHAGRAADIGEEIDRRGGLRRRRSKQALLQQQG
jgi:hypothetical protein